MNWLVDYIFDPEKFFVHLEKHNISWLFAISGLILCISLHILDFLIIADKVIVNTNKAIVKIDSSYILDPLSSYGISIFGSINIWIIWLMYIPFIICIDIIIRNEKNYISFVKSSLLSFYSMIPYLIFVLILAWMYEPVEINSPKGNSLNEFIIWIQEVSLQTSLQTIPILIKNFEYFFDIWLIALMTASYKAFSKKSYLFCGMIGLIYLALIIGIEAI